MRMFQHGIIFFLLAVILATVELPGQAIPVFSRKYGFNCTMCHSNFPRLNDFGVRYRQNGYQLPGKESEEGTVMDDPPPIAFRTSVGYNSDQFENTAGAADVNQFQVNGLDILSGELLARNIGYFLLYPPEINESRGVAPQAGTVEMANVIFSNIGSTWLNTRVGRFEPAYTAFSVARQLPVSPYEIYDFSFPGGTTFANTQTGIELTGHSWRNGFKYAAGLVDGSESNTTDDAPADFYIRGVKVFGRGEGQTAGQRIGVTGYFGRARPELGLPATGRESFNRIGVDASLNYRQLNLGVQWLHAHDNGALWGSPTSASYNGGFAELNYRPTDNFVGFARYDLVNAPDDVPLTTRLGDVRRWTIGGRYYFVDHLALHMEYSQRTQDATIAGVEDAREKFFTTRLDFAF